MNASGRRCDYCHAQALRDRRRYIQISMFRNVLASSARSLRCRRGGSLGALAHGVACEAWRAETEELLSALVLDRVAHERAQPLFHRRVHLTAAALVALWAKPQPCRVRAEGARAEPRDKRLRVARVRRHARGRRAEALLPRARQRVEVCLPPHRPCPARDPRDPPARLSRAARVARVAPVARRYVRGAIGLGAIEWQLQVDED